MPNLIPAGVDRNAPAAEVYSTHLDYATVKWLQPAGDLENSWSYPLPGALLYFPPEPQPAVALDATVDEVINAVGRDRTSVDQDLVRAVVEYLSNRRSGTKLA